MRRGVKARDTSDAQPVCSGGSRKIIWPVAKGSGLHHLEHGAVGRAERRRVAVAASTSSKRLSAQKS